MNINKIRAKQTILEAVQLTAENVEEIREWLGDNGSPSHFYPATEGFVIVDAETGANEGDQPQQMVLVFKNALGGNTAVLLTDWLVKFTDNTFAKIDDEQFHENYDILEDTPA